MWVVPVILSTTYCSLSFAMLISLFCENSMIIRQSVSLISRVPLTYNHCHFGVTSNSMLCWQGWGLLGNWFWIKQFAVTGNLLLDISKETCFSSIILLSLFVYQSTYVVHSVFNHCASCLFLATASFSST